MRGDEDGGVVDGDVTAVVGGGRSNGDVTAVVGGGRSIGMVDVYDLALASFGGRHLSGDHLADGLCEALRLLR